MAKNQIKSMVTKYKGGGFKHKLWLWNDLWNHFWLLYHMNNFSNFYWGLTLCQNSNWYWNESELKPKFQNWKTQISCFITRKIGKLYFWSYKVQNCRKDVSLCKTNDAKVVLGVFHFLGLFLWISVFLQFYSKIKLIWKNKNSQ